MLYSMFSLVIYFTHSINSIYVSMPNSQFTPPLTILWIHPLLSIYFLPQSPQPESLQQLPFCQTFWNAALPSPSPALHWGPFIQQKCIDHQWLLCARHFVPSLVSVFCHFTLYPIWLGHIEPFFGSSNKAFSFLWSVTLVRLCLKYSSPFPLSSTLLILQEAFLALSLSPRV